MTTPTYDRAPTRQEQVVAVAMGQAAGRQGRRFMDCRFRSDGGPWQAEMRRCWVEGWMDATVERVGLDDEDDEAL